MPFFPQRQKPYLPSLPRVAKEQAIGAAIQGMSGLLFGAAKHYWYDLPEENQKRGMRILELTSNLMGRSMEMAIAADNAAVTLPAKFLETSTSFQKNFNNARQAAAMKEHGVAYAKLGKAKQRRINKKIGDSGLVDADIGVFGEQKAVDALQDEIDDKTLDISSTRSTWSGVKITDKATLWRAQRELSNSYRKASVTFAKLSQSIWQHGITAGYVTKEMTDGIGKNINSIGQQAAKLRQRLKNNQRRWETEYNLKTDADLELEYGRGGGPPNKPRGYDTELAPKLELRIHHMDQRVVSDILTHGYRSGKEKFEERLLSAYQDLPEIDPAISDKFKVVKVGKSQAFYIELGSTPEELIAAMKENRFVLLPGMKGELVLRAQTQMNKKHGTKLIEDGVFGPGMKKAVFEKMNGATSIDWNKAEKILSGLEEVSYRFDEDDLSPEQIAAIARQRGVRVASAGDVPVGGRPPLPEGGHVPGEYKWSSERNQFEWVPEDPRYAQHFQYPGMKPTSQKPVGSTVSGTTRVAPTRRSDQTLENIQYGVASGPAQAEEYRKSAQQHLARAKEARERGDIKEALGLEKDAEDYEGWAKKAEQDVITEEEQRGARFAVEGAGQDTSTRTLKAVLDSAKVRWDQIPEVDPNALESEMKRAGYSVEETQGVLATLRKRQSQRGSPYFEGPPEAAPTISLVAATKFEEWASGAEWKPKEGGGVELVKGTADPANAALATAVGYVPLTPKSTDKDFAAHDAAIGEVKRQEYDIDKLKAETDLWRNGSRNVQNEFNKLIMDVNKEATARHKQRATIAGSIAKFVNAGTGIKLAGDELSDTDVDKSIGLMTYMISQDPAIIKTLMNIAKKKGTDSKLIKEMENKVHQALAQNASANVAASAEFVIAERAGETGKPGEYAHKYAVMGPKVVALIKGNPSDQEIKEHFRNNQEDVAGALTAIYGAAFHAYFEAIKNNDALAQDLMLTFKQKPVGRLDMSMSEKMFKMWVRGWSNGFRTGKMTRAKDNGNDIDPMSFLLYVRKLSKSTRTPLGPYEFGLITSHNFVGVGQRLYDTVLLESGIFDPKKSGGKTDLTELEWKQIYTIGQQDGHAASDKALIIFKQNFRRAANKDQ